jgi:hypothetical protein
MISLLRKLTISGVHSGSEEMRIADANFTFLFRRRFLSYVGGSGLPNIS